MIVGGRHGALLRTSGAPGFPPRLPPPISAQYPALQPPTLKRLNHLSHRTRQSFCFYFVLSWSQNRTKQKQVDIGKRTVQSVQGAHPRLQLALPYIRLPSSSRRCRRLLICSVFVGLPRRTGRELGHESTSHATSPGPRNIRSIQACTSDGR